MEVSIQKKQILLDRVPNEWDQDLLDKIGVEVKRSGKKIVVIDDDPTGTQTVHGVTVLTEWGVDLLEKELQTDATAFFILSNSRSLTEPDAEKLGHEIGVNLFSASRKAGREIILISRSDSTLRGHFPLEVDAMANSLGMCGAPYLIVPFFLEGGRFTIDDIHYVAEGDLLVPAGMTDFAKDRAFGFKNSDLKLWVEEKTGGRIPFDSVVSISLSDIRKGGSERVTDILSSLKRNSACIVNAISYRDMEVFVYGLLSAENKGYKFLYRSAASLVRVRADIRPRPLLSTTELLSENNNGGLFIIGSYVPKTTKQVRKLLEDGNTTSVEIDVKDLLDDEKRKSAIVSVIDKVNHTVESGRDTAVVTSRDLVTGNTAEENLFIGKQVSQSLVRIVKGLSVRPRYLVAKGGITSSDIATKGLSVSRAEVMGQVLPGVPVWKLDENAKYPGLPYIVFPGNVGDDNALMTLHRQLSGKETSKK